MSFSFSVGQRFIAWICLVAFVTTSVVVYPESARAQLAQKPAQAPTPTASTLTLPTFLIPGTAKPTEALPDPEDEERFRAQLRIASQYYQEASTDGEKALIENLFTLPLDAYLGPTKLTFKFLTSNFFRKAQELYESPRATVIALELVRNATRTFMNQVLDRYISLNKRVLGMEPALPANEFVQRSLKQTRIVTNDISRYGVNEWKKEMVEINQDITAINKVCELSHKELEKLSQGLHKYKEAQKQFNFNIRNHPDLIKLLYPNGFDPNIVSGGGYEGMFRDRIQNVKNQTVDKLSTFTFMRSNTLIGEIYDASPRLKEHMGELDGLKCSTTGMSDLNPITSETIPVIMESFSEISQTYRESILQLIENEQEENVFKVLSQYIRENPTSIQMALNARPNPDAVLLIAGLLEDEKKREKDSRDRQIAITLLTIPAGAYIKAIQGAVWATRFFLVLSTYYGISTIIDLRTSYHMEDRITQALLAGQISRERGEAIIKSIQNRRPFSYANLVLSGLSAAASAMRLKQLSDWNKMMDATTGSQVGSKIAGNVPKVKDILPAPSIGGRTPVAAAQGMGIKMTPSGGGTKLTTDQVDDIAAWISNPKITPPSGGGGVTTAAATSTPVTSTARMIDTPQGAFLMDKTLHPFITSPVLNQIKQVQQQANVQVQQTLNPMLHYGTWIAPLVVPMTQNQAPQTLGDLLTDEQIEEIRKVQETSKPKDVEIHSPLKQEAEKIIRGRDYSLISDEMILQIQKMTRDTGELGRLARAWLQRYKETHNIERDVINLLNGYQTKNIPFSILHLQEIERMAKDDSHLIERGLARDFLYMATLNRTYARLAKPREMSANAIQLKQNFDLLVAGLKQFFPNLGEKKLIEFANHIHENFYYTPNWTLTNGKFSGYTYLQLDPKFVLSEGRTYELNLIFVLNPNKETRIVVKRFLPDDAKIYSIGMLLKLMQDGQLVQRRALAGGDLALPNETYSYLTANSDLSRPAQPFVAEDYEEIPRTYSTPAPPEHFTPSNNPIPQPITTPLTNPVESPSIQDPNTNQILNSLLPFERYGIVTTPPTPFSMVESGPAYRPAPKKAPRLPDRHKKEPKTPPAKPQKPAQPNPAKEKNTQSLTQIGDHIDNEQLKNLSEQIRLLQESEKTKDQRVIEIIQGQRPFDPTLLSELNKMAKRRDLLGDKARSYLNTNYYNETNVTVDMVLNDTRFVLNDEIIYSIVNASKNENDPRSEKAKQWIQNHTDPNHPNYQKFLNWITPVLENPKLSESYGQYVAITWLGKHHNSAKQWLERRKNFQLALLNKIKELFKQNRDYLYEDTLEFEGTSYVISIGFQKISIRERGQDAKANIWFSYQVDPNQQIKITNVGIFLAHKTNNTIVHSRYITGEMAVELMFYFLETVLGHTISSIQGDWGSTEIDGISTNFTQYIKQMNGKSSDDMEAKIQAAKNTWSAQQYSRYGFQPVDVAHHYLLDMNHYQIFTTFKRPENSTGGNTLLPPTTPINLITTASEPNFPMRPSLITWEEKLKIEIEPTTQKTMWQLLHEAMSGEFTIPHIMALRNAKEGCLKENADKEFCTQIISKLYSIDYAELKKFSVDPKEFIEWWETLKYVMVDGKIMANPFTLSEIAALYRQANIEFEHLILIDADARGAKPHMTQHMANVDRKRALIEALGINFEYYRLLVFLHDAGKYISSARVLLQALKKYEKPGQQKLFGKVAWHDQSTVEYLLDLGQRLNIDPAKMEHLIKDIVGHNDGSGLLDIFWNKVYPGYPLPLRLECYLLALFDRLGQGDWTGAAKILPATIPTVFFDKVHDAYYENPNNTIRQLEVIYESILKLLQERAHSPEAEKLLKETFDEAVAMQRETMDGYSRLKWSNDRSTVSITSNGQTYESRTVQEFLRPEFQEALISSGNNTGNNGGGSNTPPSPARPSAPSGSQPSTDKPNVTIVMPRPNPYTSPVQTIFKGENNEDLTIILNQGLQFDVFKPIQPKLETDIYFGDPLPESNDEEREAIRRIHEQNKSRMQKAQEILDKRLVDIAYNREICIIAHTYNNALGERARRFISERGIDCRVYQRFYYELSPSEAEYDFPNDQLDPLKAIEGVFAETDQEFNLTALAIDVAFGKKKVSDLRLLDEICRLYEGALTPAVHNKVFEYISSQGINCYTKIIVPTSDPLSANVRHAIAKHFSEFLDTQSLERRDEWRLLLKDLKSKDVFDPSDTPKAPNVFYIMDEIFRLIDHKEKEAFFLKALKSRGENIYSPRDLQDSIQGQMLTRHLKTLSNEEAELIRLHLISKGEIKGQDEDGRLRSITFSNEPYNLRMRRQLKSIRIKDMGINVEVPIRTNWDDVKQDVDGYIYIPGEDVFQNKYYFKFLNPKYLNVKDAQDFFNKQLNDDEIAELTSLIFDQAKQIQQFSPRMRSEKYIQDELWRMLYIAYDLKNLIVYHSYLREVGRDDVEVANNWHGLKESLLSLHASDNTIEEIKNTLNGLDFFIDFEKMQTELFQSIRFFLEAPSETDLQDATPFASTLIHMAEGLVLKLNDKQRFEFLSIIKRMREDEPQKLLYFFQTLATNVFSTHIADFVDDFLKTNGENIQTRTEQVDLNHLRYIFDHSMKSVNPETEASLVKHFTRLSKTKKHIKHLKDSTFSIQLTTPYLNLVTINFEEARTLETVAWVPVRDAAGHIIKFLEYVTNDPQTYTFLERSTLDYEADPTEGEDVVLNDYQHSKSPTPGKPEFNLGYMNQFRQNISEGPNATHHASMKRMMAHFMEAHQNERILFVPAREILFGVPLEQFKIEFEAERRPTVITQRIFEGYTTINDPALENYLARGLGLKRIFVLRSKNTAAVYKGDQGKIQTLVPDLQQYRISLVIHPGGDENIELIFLEEKDFQ